MLSDVSIIPAYNLKGQKWALDESPYDHVKTATTISFKRKLPVSLKRICDDYADDTDPISGRVHKIVRIESPENNDDTIKKYVLISDIGARVVLSRNGQDNFHDENGIPIIIRDIREDAIVGSAFKQLENDVELQSMNYDERVELAKLLIDDAKHNNLTSLNLNNFCLKELPDTIGMLEGLTRLEARGNNLSSLPETFSNLRKLKYLDLSYNQFKTVPDCIGTLTSLETLSVSCNSELKQIHTNYNNNRSLKNFDVVNTKLNDRAINLILHYTSTVNKFEKTCKQLNSILLQKLDLAVTNDFFTIDEKMIMNNWFSLYKTNTMSDENNYTASNAGKIFNGLSLFIELPESKTSFLNIVKENICAVKVLKTNWKDIKLFLEQAKIKTERLEITIETFLKKFSFEEIYTLNMWISKFLKDEGNNEISYYIEDIIEIYTEITQSIKYTEYRKKFLLKVTDNIKTSELFIKNCSEILELTQSSFVLETLFKITFNFKEMNIINVWISTFRKDTSVENCSVYSEIEEIRNVLLSFTHPNNDKEIILKRLKAKVQMVYGVKDE